MLFDTTLFGLIGLGIVGTSLYLLRMSANNVTLAIDKWTNEAINLLKEESFLQTLIEGLFETDHDGQVKKENDKPVLRLQPWFDAIRSGLLVTNEKGRTHV